MPHARPWLLLAIGLAGGCKPPPDADADSQPSTAIHVIDAAANDVRLPGPARRIVSLVPSATQTLRALGAEGSLVGRTDYDTEPWAAHLPSVGGGIGPNLETLVALEPDLVVRFAAAQDPRTPARLDELGIKHLAVRPDRIDDIYRTARLLGQVTGHAAAADSLVAGLRLGLRQVSERASAFPRLRVAYVLGGSPPWVAGAGTYIDEIISLAGGDNVFADLGVLYSAVSPEELLSREIDVVLVSSGGEFEPNLAPHARIEVIGSALEIPGPDVVDAAYAVAEALHGRSLR